MGFNYTDEHDDEDLNANNHFVNDAADGIVDDTMLDLEQEPEQLLQETIRERAIKQMEHANLYRVLLEGNIFAPNSARPEIQSKVESEIKLFIEERLVELLNIGQARKPEVKAQFDDKEVSALKILANKLAEKMPSSVQLKPKDEPRLPTPSVNAVTVVHPVSASPVLNTVKLPPQAQAAPPKSNKVKKQDSAPASAPVSVTTQPQKKAKKNYSQINNPQKTKMPSLAEQEALYLNQMRVMGSNVVLDQVLRTATTEGE